MVLPKIHKKETQIRNKTISAV